MKYLIPIAFFLITILVASLVTPEMSLTATHIDEDVTIMASAKLRERAPEDAPISSPRPEDALEIADAPANFAQMERLSWLRLSVAHWPV